MSDQPREEIEHLHLGWNWNSQITNKKSDGWIELDEPDDANEPDGWAEPEGWIDSDGSAEPDDPNESDGWAEPDGWMEASCETKPARRSEKCKSMQNR